MITLPKVTLGMSFAELFGEKTGEVPVEIRRERWGQWLAKAGPEGRDRWNNAVGCIKDGKLCKHFQNNWCALQGLPCSVNPVLTFRSGMIGMACMGAGFEPDDKQLDLL